MTQHRSSVSGSMLTVFIAVWAGCGAQNPVPRNLSPGVIIKQQRMDALHEELVAKVTSANVETMTKPGLVGAVGGARLKLLESGSQLVILPIPQMVDCQVPVCYYIRSTPHEAVDDYRVQRREELNDVVSVQLKGARNQEVQLEWSSVVLIAGKQLVPGDTRPDSLRSATACVQADSSEIKNLAEKRWPKNDQVEEYGRSIQRCIREMKRAKQPRSLDAIGILDSGMNGICTANANLALALMRAKGIPSRSMAVIPPISQRLEMHRIVEYHDDDQWHYFDPSALHPNVPMRPWQTVIMAKTTVADENLSMQPRMGAMLGCPYAQELELISAGVTLWGQDFFWTMATPLAEFEPEEEAISLAIDAWNKYLQQGVLSAGQIKAAVAGNSSELTAALKTE